MQVSAQKPSTIETYARSEAGRDACLKLAAALNIDNPTLRPGTLATAARLAGMASFASGVIAELGDEPISDQLEAIATLYAEGVSPIILGPRCELSDYRRYLAAGAQDYIELPLVAGAELSLLSDKRGAQLNSTRAQRGRLIAVCGTCGGAGVSLLSANLAAFIAASGLEMAKTALLDADLISGTLAVDLNCTQTKGYIDALEKPTRVDLTFFEATMAEPLPRLRLFSAELADLTQLSSLYGGLPDLIRAIRGEFQTILVDLPRKLVLDKSSTLLEEVDELILVVAPGFGSVRMLGRLIAAAKACAKPPRFTLVLSQLRSDAGLSAKEISNAVGEPIWGELPLATRDITRAHIAGSPVVMSARNSRYSRSVVALSQYLSTTDTVVQAAGTRKKAGILGRLFS